jgi:hypothetical protein
MIGQLVRNGGQQVEAQQATEERPIEHLRVEVAVLEEAIERMKLERRLHRLREEFTALVEQEAAEEEAAEAIARA